VRWEYIGSPIAKANLPRIPDPDKLYGCSLYPCRVPLQKLSVAVQSLSFRFVADTVYKDPRSLTPHPVIYPELLIMKITNKQQGESQRSTFTGSAAARGV